jgi:hypothetical protein
VKQHVRFCSATDGVRLAYAVHGSGPPLVRVATWLSHLEFDWESPVWRHWLKGLGDAIVLPSMAEHTLTVCPAAAASWYDGVGHMPFWEASGRFDRELAGLAHGARSRRPARL